MLLIVYSTPSTIFVFSVHCVLNLKHPIRNDEKDGNVLEMNADAYFSMNMVKLYNNIFEVSFLMILSNTRTPSFPTLLMRRPGEVTSANLAFDSTLFKISVLSIYTNSFPKKRKIILS